jgi:hypothetical protein
LSKVDSRLATIDRLTLLEEIKRDLPAFLRSDTVERVDPAGDVRHLLNLSSADLDRVIATHIALSDEVGAFLEKINDALRQPIMATTRPKIPTQTVRGMIDWGATIKHRAVSGWDSTQFVVRPARRLFDTPENRALAWLLDRLDSHFRQVLPARTDERVGVHNKNWLGEIEARHQIVRNARRHWWLRDVRAEFPNTNALQRLGAARTAVYRIHLPPEDVVKVLSLRYFEPEKDWLLFEVAVALRLARTFSKKSTGLRRARLLVGVGATPYAIYKMPDGSEVRLWYQSWPPAARESLQAAARKKYSIEASPVRPDLIVERVMNGQSQGLLLELKASKSSDYLALGLFQLMGYLKDRPAMFSSATSAWLVAPESSAFESVPAEGLDLWVVDADQVSEAALRFFGFEGEVAATS